MLKRIDIVANTQLTSVTEFEQLVVTEIDGAIIYLKDIANIELASEEVGVTARLNHNDTVYISIWPLPGANEIEIGDRLYTAVEELNTSLPQGFRL